MRIIVNCASGKSHLMQLPPDFTVHELKVRLMEIEGIAIDQQEIIFGGRTLDNDYSLVDYAIQEYSLADEIVLYLQQTVAAPLKIFLSGHKSRPQIITEIIEETMLLTDVQKLLVQRGVAAAFSSNAATIVKRQDGSTLLLDIDVYKHSVNDLKEMIKSKEGLLPDQLVFLQAHDGALHIQFTPCQQKNENSYPVYKRATLPQQLMMKKPFLEGDHLPDVAKELCVLP